VTLEIIEDQTSIKRQELVKGQYTVSLLKECYRVGLVDKKSIDSVQAQIMLILKDLIMRYTRGESTSVTIDTAERIFNSICYCIDAYICGFNNPKDGMTALKAENIRKIYEKGIVIVTSCIAEAKILYKDIVKNRLEVPHEAYNATIDEALHSFFENYGVVFDAQNTMASIDYPLIFDDMSIKGVFYIKQYLEHLKIETEFCRLFNREDVVKTLSNYGRVYSIDYMTSLINIFEVVINNSIFSVLSGNKGDMLTISKFQYDLLNSKLACLNPYEINTIMDEAIEKVIKDLGINQYKLIDYIHQYKSIFMPRVLNAVENGNLQNMVITDDREELQDSTIIFEEGDRMSDDSFSLVINRIMECQNTDNKIEIIKSSICSSQDFMDVLSGDCLFEDEFEALFSTLSDMELSILGGAVFYEELRCGTLDLALIILDKEEVEAEWQTHYINFMQRLGKDRIESIQRLINNIGL